MVTNSIEIAINLDYLILLRLFLHIFFNIETECKEFALSKTKYIYFFVYYCVSKSKYDLSILQGNHINKTGVFLHYMF